MIKFGTLADMKDRVTEMQEEQKGSFDAPDFESRLNELTKMINELGPLTDMVSGFLEVDEFKELKDTLEEANLYIGKMGKEIDKLKEFEGV